MGITVLNILHEISQKQGELHALSHLLTTNSSQEMDRSMTFEK